MLLRHHIGDVYPFYSSLRSDPLGVKAFYESLENIPNIKVDRNYKDSPKLNETPNAVFLAIGVRIGALRYVDKKELELFEQFIKNGGRLVLTLYPEKKDYFLTDEDSLNKCELDKLNNQGKTGKGGNNNQTPAELPVASNQNKTDSKGGQAQKGGKIDPESQKRFTKKKKQQQNWVSLLPRWGVKPGYCDSAVVHAKKKSDSDLPDKLSWHAKLFFDPFDTQWRVLYTSNGKPVMIEKKIGAGSVVLSADSFFLSNQALLEERYPTLLTWLLGGYRTVIFDESHFGVIERQGVVNLIQKYRLQGVFVALFLLASLFIWKNAVSLVPPRTDEIAYGYAATGKDSTSGLINLLKYHIHPNALIKACVDEWKKSFLYQKDKIKLIESVEGLATQHDTLKTDYVSKLFHPGPQPSGKSSNQDETSIHGTGHPVVVYQTISRTINSGLKKR